MADIGVRRVDFGYFVRPAEETGTGRCRVEPALGYLIDHPTGGLVLVDTGMGRHPEVDAHYRPRRVPMPEALATAGAKLDDIAYVAGIVKGSLYHYFDSKDDLAAACLSQLALDDLEALVTIAKRLSAAPTAQLHAIVAAAAAKMEHPAYRGWLLSNLEVEIHDDHHVISRVCRLYKARLRSHLQDAAEQAGVEAPDQLADGLLLLLEGAGVSFRSLGPQEAATSMIRGWNILLREHGAHFPIEQAAF